MADERRFQQSRENFRRRLLEERANVRRTIILPNVLHPPPTTNRLLRTIVRPNNTTATFDTPINNNNVSGDISEPSRDSLPTIARPSSWAVPPLAIVGPTQLVARRLSSSSRTTTTTSEGEDLNVDLPIPALSSDSSSLEENNPTQLRIPYIPIVEDISSESDEIFRNIHRQFEGVEQLVNVQPPNVFPVNPPWFADVDSEGEPINNEPFHLPLSQQYDPDQANNREDTSSSNTSTAVLSSVDMTSANTTPRHTSTTPPPEENNNPPKRFFMSIERMEKQKDVFGNLKMVEGVVRYRYFVKRQPQESIDKPNTSNLNEETSEVSTQVRSTDESPRRKKALSTDVDNNQPRTSTIPEISLSRSSKEFQVI